MQIIKPVITTLLSLAIFGFALYYLTIRLAGYSNLYALLGNLALIVLVLAVDTLSIKSLQSEKIIVRMKKEKDPEKSFRILKRGLNASVSFKTDLYLLYVIILVASQVIEFYPAFAGEDLRNFVNTNSYSILLLVAFDSLIGRFSKDREDIKNALAKLEKTWTENQD